MVGKRILLLTLVLSMGSTQAGWTDAFSFDTSKLSSAFEHGLQKLNENRNSVGAAVATGLIGASLAYYAAKRKPAVSDVSVATDLDGTAMVNLELLKAEASAKDSRISELESSLNARLEAEASANAAIASLEAEKAAWLVERSRLTSEKEQAASVTTSLELQLSSEVGRTSSLTAELGKKTKLANSVQQELQSLQTELAQQKELNASLALAKEKAEASQAVASRNQELSAQIESLQSDLAASTERVVAQTALAKSFEDQAAGYKKQFNDLFPELAKAAESAAVSGELVEQKESELAALRLQLATSEDAVAKAKSELEVVIQRFQSLQSENERLVQALTSSEDRFKKLDTEFTRHREGVAEKLAEYDKVMRENERRAALLDSRQISADVSTVNIDSDLTLSQLSAGIPPQSGVVASVSEIDAEASDPDTSWTQSDSAKQITALAAAVAAASVSSSEDESVVEEAAASSAYVNVPFEGLSLEMQERLKKASPTFSPADAKILEMGDDANPLILADMVSQKALHWLQEDGKSSFGGTKYKLEPFGAPFSFEIDILAFRCDQNYLLTWVNGAGNLVALVCLSSDQDPVKVYFAEDSDVRLTSSSRVKFEVNDKDVSVNLEIDGSEFVGNYCKDDSSGSTYYYIDKK